MDMKDRITDENRKQVVKEILAVLERNNLPTNNVIGECAHAFMKVVSHQHQMSNET